MACVAASAVFIVAALEVAMDAFTTQIAMILIAGIAVLCAGVFVWTRGRIAR